MATRSLSFIDLFAGAGGWSVGFEAAEFKHIAMYELNESACETAKSNFGDIVQKVDLLNHKDIDFPEVDIVCGSPPCQGFSNEGKKQKNDPRNNLIWSFLEVVRKVKPKIWVFENVPGFKRSYGGYYYNLLLKELDKEDYKWRDFILDSASFGVPQHRERFILVAARDFSPSPPEPTHGRYDDFLSQETYVSLWDAISDLPTPRLGDRIGNYSYVGEAQNDYQRLMRRRSPSVKNHTAQNHSARVLEKIRAVPIGGDMSSIVQSFQENQVHYCGGYRRARKETPSYTAYWTRGMTSIHPEQHRFLTPRECARIQSFPDKFIFQGTTIENYTQVCNAVPPLLAQALAESIRAQSQDAEKKFLLRSRKSA